MVDRMMAEAVLGADPENLIVAILKAADQLDRALAEFEADPASARASAQALHERLAEWHRMEPEGGD